MPKEKLLKYDSLSFDIDQIEKFSQTLNVLVAIIDTSHKLVFFNKKGNDIFDTEGKKLMGSDWFKNFVDGEIRETLMKQIDEYIEKGISGFLTHEQKAIDKNGNKRVFRWHYSIMENDKKEIIGVVCVGIDITDEILAKEALEKNRIGFQLLAESIGDIFFAVDNDYRVIYWNKLAEENTGILSKDILGQSFFTNPSLDKAPAAEIEKLKETFKEVIDSKKGKTISEKGIFGNEDLLFEISIFPIETGISVLARDVTSSRIIEDNLRIQNDISYKLSSADTLEEALNIFIHGAIDISRMDSGGIHFIDDLSGCFDLSFSTGFQSDFVEAYSRHDVNSEFIKNVLTLKPSYLSFEELEHQSRNSLELKEGLHSIAVIPLSFDEKVIGCIHVASHTLDEVPMESRPFLEMFTLHFANYIAKIRSGNKLRESEELYRTLLFANPDSVAITDLEGNIIALSDQTLRVHGFESREELERMNAFDLIDPEYHQKAKEAFRKVAKEGVIRNLELLSVKKDGTKFFLEANGGLLRDAKGNPKAIVTVARDITERKQTTERLRRLNRSLRMISEFNQAIVRAESTSELMTKLCNILTMTGGYRFSWIGFTRHDDLRRVVPVAFAGHDSGFLEKIAGRGNGNNIIGAVNVAISGKKVVILNNISKDSESKSWRDDAIERGYYSSIAIPLISGDGSILGALNIFSSEIEAFDAEEINLLSELSSDLVFGITSLRIKAEREKAERELRANIMELSNINTQLEQVAREASLARGEAATYLDLLCHDIANYTTPVRAYIEMIGTHPEFPVSLRKPAERVITSIEMIGTLISRLRLLTIANQGITAELNRMDLVEILQGGIEKSLHENPKKEIRFNLESKHESAWIMADDRILYAFSVILDNAIRYNPSRICNVDIQLEEISVGAKKYWRISVLDYGQGLSDDLKQTVFRRFDGYWELKRTFGIGLFLSRIIVEYHNGQIWLEDRVPGEFQKGIKAVILLPKEDNGDENRDAN